jgi:hypothetical protein
MPTATVYMARYIFETFALGIDPIVWPYTLLTNDAFYSPKPPRHCRVVIRKIEIL